VVSTATDAVHEHSELRVHQLAVPAIRGDVCLADELLCQLQLAHQLSHKQVTLLAYQAEGAQRAHQRLHSCCCNQQGEVNQQCIQVAGFWLADMFFHHVYRQFGMPRAVTSDRGPQFDNHLWRNLCERFGINLRMSSAYHPETDGQTERANRTIEDMLRAYVTPHQTDWDLHLTAIEFAYNNSVQASTGYTPFYLNYGRHPQLAGACVVPEPLQENESCNTDPHTPLTLLNPTTVSNNVPIEERLAWL
jgi:hypothetical protein